jgi:molybdate transport system permease protein
MSAAGDWPRRPRALSEPPRTVWIPAALAAGFFCVPIAALAFRVPWGSLGRELAAPEVVQAIELSLVCSCLATALSLALGLPLAWLFARSEFPGRAALRAIVTLPALLPPVVGGVALLLAFGRRGWLGSLLEQWFGITIPFTTAAAVLAEAYIAMPFLVFAAESGFRESDVRYEEAAATLGAGPWRRFFRVTLPLAAPGIGAGAVLCWARALGEFGATITFAGSFPGRTQTMPIAVLLALESRPDAAVALSFLMLATALLVLLVFRNRWLPRA